MERNGFSSVKSRFQASPWSLPNFLCSVGVFPLQVTPGRCRHPSLKVVQAFWIVLVFSVEFVSKCGWGGELEAERQLLNI